MKTKPKSGKKREPGQSPPALTSARSAEAETRLQNLLYDATAGSRLEVPGKEFQEQIVIDRPLEVVGHEMSTKVLAPESPALIVTAPDVTLRNMTIGGAGEDNSIAILAYPGTVPRLHNVLLRGTVFIDERAEILPPEALAPIPHGGNPGFTDRSQTQGVGRGWLDKVIQRLYSHAESCERAGNWKGAAEAYVEILQTDPRQFDAFRLLTRVCHKMGPDHSILTGLLCGGASNIPRETVHFVRKRDRGNDGDGDGNPDCKLLIEAARRCDLSAARALMEKGSSPCSKDSSGISALGWAIASCNDSLVKEMLKSEPPDLQERELILASSLGCEKTVRLWLGCGVDVNAADEMGRTALMCAASNGHSSVVALLLRRGANPNCQDVNGETARSLAAKRGHRKVVKILTRPSKGKQSGLRSLFRW